MTTGTEIKLACGAVVRIGYIRTTTMANTSEKPYWLPFVDIIYEGEVESKDFRLTEVTIPIQLRSIDQLIILLGELKEEMKK